MAAPRRGGAASVAARRRPRRPGALWRLPLCLAVLACRPLRPPCGGPPALGGPALARAWQPARRSSSRRGRPPLDGLAVGRRLAEERGGRLLSERYEDSQEPLVWQCGACHGTWRACLASVRHGGSWCPGCAAAGRRLDGMAAARRLAEDRGGRLLSESYEGSQKPLLWQCAAGHRPRTATLSSVRTALLRTGLSAAWPSQGGLPRSRVLGDAYEGCRTPVIWQRRAGHRHRRASASSVKQRGDVAPGVCPCQQAS
uniref:Zinc-ribbon domain-containing protein n=1 Tax=Alexandrium monilatum TaxID=311494 RepID=A0A7S4RPN4_9DINO